MRSLILQKMVLVTAKIVLLRTTWRRELNLGHVLSVAVLSWVHHSPLEREPSVQDYCLASERQRLAGVEHPETLPFSDLQRRQKYSRPTFGSNTTTSAVSRM